MNQYDRQQYADNHPFLKVFSIATLQQYFLDGGHITLSDIFRISTTHSVVREKFLSHYQWKLIILRKLIFRKANKIAVTSGDHYMRNFVERNRAIERARRSDPYATQEALVMAKKIQNGFERGRAVGEIAILRARKKGDVHAFQAALVIAHKIDHNVQRAYAEGKLAILRAKRGDANAIEDAQAIAQEIVHPVHRSRAERVIALEQDRRDNDDTIEDSLTTQEKMRKENHFHFLGHNIAIQRIEEGDQRALQDALAFSGQIKNHFQRARTLCHIAFCCNTAQIPQFTNPKVIIQSLYLTVNPTGVKGTS